MQQSNQSLQAYLLQQLAPQSRFTLPQTLSGQQHQSNGLGTAASTAMQSNMTGLLLNQLSHSPLMQPNTSSVQNSLSASNHLTPNSQPFSGSNANNPMSFFRQANNRSSFMDLAASAIPQQSTQNNLAFARD